ncbi:MAG: IS66 family transposase [Plesiomonas sp.]
MQQIQSYTDYKVLYEQQQQLNEQQQLQIASLQHQLSNLQKLIFGSKTEQFIPALHNPAQLSLAIQADSTAQQHITAVQKISYTRVKTEVKPNHPGRHKLPEHLERREQVIEPAGDISSLKKIGEEVTEELDYEPGKLFVNRYVRPKYAKPGNEGVLIAPVMDRPFAKSVAGTGLLAQLVIDKYVDHLPLYRQMEQFKREGVTLASSTVADAVSKCCALIEPLYHALVKSVLQSSYLHADETAIKVLDKDKKGTTHRGYYWVYHNSTDGLVWFDYQQGRGREGPQQQLSGFSGFLQTDGYAVYDLFKQTPEVTVLHCMAHARRKFFEAQDNDLPRTAYALEQIGLLYQLERRTREQQLDESQVLELRRQKALPVLEALGLWMKEQYVQVLPKSPIGKALAYSIERWKELCIYATNGKLNIDNNPVENSIRPVAIGRKNYLFAGGHEAAQRSAMLYSLLGTCKLHNVNPFIWMRDILKRIANHPISSIEELLPHKWKPLQ